MQNKEDMVNHVKALIPSDGRNINLDGNSELILVDKSAEGLKEGISHQKNGVNLNDPKVNSRQGKEIANETWQHLAASFVEIKDKGKGILIEEEKFLGIKGDIGEPSNCKDYDNSGNESDSS